MLLCHCAKTCILHNWHSKFIRVSTVYVNDRSLRMVPTPLKILRVWFWLRRLKFSKLEESAIRSLVPLGVFKLPEITVDSRIPVVREPKFRTLRLHLTSRSIRVYSVRVHILTGTSVSSNRLKSKCFTSVSFYSQVRTFEKITSITNLIYCRIRKPFRKEIENLYLQNVLLANYLFAT